MSAARMRERAIVLIEMRYFSKARFAPRKNLKIIKFANSAKKKIDRLIDSIV